MRREQLLLGRTPASGRIRIIEELAKSYSPEALRLYQQAFDSEHCRAISRCRNTVAHDRLLGLTNDDHIAFQVHERQGFEIGKVVMSVFAYPHDAYEQFAYQAESIIPHMEAAFGLKAIREERRGRSLSPHMKSGPKQKPHT